MTTPTGASPRTHDLRVTGFQPLVSPAALRDELPLGSTRAALVEDGRRAVNAVLTGEDDRLLLVVGPCSVHDAAAARDYAHRLAAAVAPLSDELCVVMRAYFEKPRTTVGWRA
jgi:3-deoxy-7-phosphoheptulonate synthase